jgi:predicted component of type VI protein secretion system
LHENEVLIRHLGFVPELKVNGKSVIKSVLQDGDQIEMGPYLMRVHVETSPTERNDTDEPADESIETDESEIESQVETLLDDIRATFFPDMQHLRLYVESKPTLPQDTKSNEEIEPPQTKRRASGG